MKNKHFIPGFLLGLLIMLVIAAVPIANLVLQTDMNAGGHSITNVTSILDPSGNPITGGGSVTASAIEASQTNYLGLTNSMNVFYGAFHGDTFAGGGFTGNGTGLTNTQAGSFNLSGSNSIAAQVSANVASSNLITSAQATTAAQGVVSTNVLVYRGSALLTYPSLTNYYTAGFSPGDYVKLGKGTNFSFGIGPMQLQPGMTIEGLGTNQSFLFYETNCFTATNNVILKNFTAFETNYPSTSPAGFPSFLSGGAGGSCANFYLESMSLVNPGGIAINFSVSGCPNMGITAKNSYIESGLSFFFSANTSSTGYTYWKDIQIYMRYQTNINSLIWSAFEPNGSMSNTVINVDVIHDLNFTTNNPETIAYFGSGATYYINNLTAHMINTNNLPFQPKYEELILTEQASGYGGVVGPQQPSSSFVSYNLSPPSTNLYPSFSVNGDWTKLGLNEINLLTNGPISVVSNGMFVIPQNNSVDAWCSSVATGPNYQDFLNYIRGYPYGAMFTITNAMGGLPADLILTNSQYGYSLDISAVHGMYITNFGSGPNALVLSNNADFFNITNLGVAPNAVQMFSQAVSGGTYTGLCAKNVSFVYPVNGGLSTNLITTANLTYAPVGFFDTYSGCNFIRVGAPNTATAAITNIWVAYAPPGARGTSFTISPVGATTNIQFTDGLLSTNTLYFTNGILQRTSQP